MYTLLLSGMCRVDGARSEVFVVLPNGLPMLRHVHTRFICVFVLLQFCVKFTHATLSVFSTYMYLKCTIRTLFVHTSNLCALKPIYILPLFYFKVLA